MANYYPLEKAAQKLNIDEYHLKALRATGDVFYSKKTDKYNIDSILESRTMTIGIDKFLTKEERIYLESMMKDYSSLKFKIFKELTKGTKFNTSGTDRLHRIITKQINPKFTNLIADTALADAQGLFQSSLTWKMKYEDNLAIKIAKLSEKLGQIGQTKEQRQHIRQSINLNTLKLKKSQEKSYKSIWFGGKHLKGEEQDIEKYRLSRLEMFVQGTSGSGNAKLGIVYAKDGKSYNLKIFDKTVKNIKIPSAHRATFSLDGFNRQSSRISFNKNDKMILNLTYSYQKPMKIDNYEKSKGTIGIDIGTKEIAVSYVKNDGNPFKYVHYSTANLVDARNEEKQRQLSSILDKIIDEGIENGFTHISIENLDSLHFKKTGNRSLNRLLAKFPKQIFEDLINSKCARKGIKIKKVNPAYTSIIGLFKYSNRDNLSISHSSKSKDLSAALAIGRRGLGFIEKPIISVRVLGRFVSKSITSLLKLPEDNLSKKDITYKSHNYLWKALKMEFTSVNALTERLYANLSDDYLNKVSRVSFPSNIRNDIAVYPF